MFGRARKKVDAVERVATATQGLSSEAQAEAMKAVVDSPAQRTTDLLWLIFVPGLFILTIFFGGMVYELIRDEKTATDPALLRPILSFVIGSLVGVFLPTPVAKKAEE